MFFIVRVSSEQCIAMWNCLPHFATLAILTILWYVKHKSFLGTVEARLERSRLLIERLQKEEAKDRKTQLGMTVSVQKATLCCAKFPLIARRGRARVRDVVLFLSQPAFSDYGVHVRGLWRFLLNVLYIYF